MIWAHNMFGFEDIPNWVTGRVHATYLRGRRIYDGRDVDGVDGQLL